MCNYAIETDKGKDAVRKQYSWMMKDQEKKASSIMNGYKYMIPFCDLRTENYDKHNHSLTSRYINFIAFQW